MLTDTNVTRSGDGGTRAPRLLIAPPNLCSGRTLAVVGVGRARDLKPLLDESRLVTRRFAALADPR